MRRQVAGERGLRIGNEGVGGWLGGIRGMDERMVGVPVVAAGSHLHLVDLPRPGIFNTQICLLKYHLSELHNLNDKGTENV